MFRVEITFRFIPEEYAVVEQRTGRDKPCQHGKFPYALGNQMHFEIPNASLPQIKPAVRVQKQAPSHLFFQRL